MRGAEKCRDGLVPPAAAICTVLYNITLHVAAGGHGGAILIVDDIESNLLALEALLDHAGATIVRASSGADALRAVAKDDFSLVLLDVQMPEMDGLKLPPRSVAIPARAGSRSFS